MSVGHKPVAATGFVPLARARVKGLSTKMRLLGRLVAPVVMKRLTPGQWTDAVIHKTIIARTNEIAYHQDVRDWRHDGLVLYDDERGIDSKHFVLANAGKTLDGDWDLVRIPFEECDIYRLLHEHFVEGVDWEHTEVFRRFERDVVRGKMRWNKSRSREELLRASERCDRLFARLSRQGYRPNGNSGVVPFADEITVSIGRSGELLFNNVGGRHRLSIAKILGIEHVPVRVLLRHASWQAVRDELRRTTSVNHLDLNLRRRLTHPDLADLTPVAWVPEAAELDEPTVRTAA